MKIIKSALFLVVITFATTLSQPLPPAGRSAENLQNDLNLSDSQKEKIEKILVQKRIKLDNIRNKMMTIMENLRDSTQYVSKEIDKEILKILTKEQAENFKTETERNNQFAMMPPAGMIGNGLSLHMPVPNQAVFCQPGQGGQPQGQPTTGMFNQDPCEADCMGYQDDSSGPDFVDPCLPDSDDIDLLQDLDLFDLMDILE